MLRFSPLLSPLPPFPPLTLAGRGELEWGYGEVSFFVICGYGLISIIRRRREQSPKVRIYAPDHGEGEIIIVAADEDNEFRIYALDIVRFFASLLSRLSPSLSSFDVWHAGVSGWGFGEMSLFILFEVKLTIIFPKDRTVVYKRAYMRLTRSRLIAFTQLYLTIFVKLETLTPVDTWRERVTFIAWIRGLMTIKEGTLLL